MASDRSSEAGKPVLVSDPQQVARIEAENTLRQFDVAMAELDAWIKDSKYRLRPSKVMELNRIALERLSEYAGTNRPGGIKITGSHHIPPDASQVQALMEDLCDYINDNFAEANAIHLAAYTLWKINWIHPFVDGNGRTARVVSYIVMCAKIGSRLPGTKTIPDQIATDKKPYYLALEAADAAFKDGRVDVSAIEALIDRHLAVQLLDIHESAAGKGAVDRSAVPDAIQAHVPVRPNRKTSVRWTRHIETHPVLYGLIGAIVVAVLTVIVPIFLGRP